MSERGEGGEWGGVVFVVLIVVSFDGLFVTLFIVLFDRLSIPFSIDGLFPIPSINPFG